MSTTQSKNSLSVFNFICGGLGVVLIGLWCAPYWQADGTSVSMFSYIAIPEEYKALTEYIASQVGGDYSITNIVGPVVLQLLLGVVAMLLCFFKSEKVGGTVVALISGCLGLWGFLTKEALKLGSMWGAFLAISVLTILVAVIGIVMYTKNK